MGGTSGLAEVEPLALSGAVAEAVALGPLLWAAEGAAALADFAAEVCAGAAVCDPAPAAPLSPQARRLAKPKQPMTRAARALVPTFARTRSHLGDITMLSHYYG